MTYKTKEVFDNIAQKYDLMNDLLSFGLHRFWKRKMVELCEIDDNSLVLDCATGTADIPILISKKVSNNTKVIGIDINEKMLEIGREKTRAYNNIVLKIADAEAIPFEDNYFNVCTIAYGVRNITNLERALKEMARVVKSGGKVVILEFGQPQGLWGKIFKLYSTYFIPFAGKLIARSFSSYKYLHDTISVFPCGEKFIKILQKTDAFSDYKYIKLCGGVSYIYLAKVK